MSRFRLAGHGNSATLLVKNAAYTQSDSLGDSGLYSSLVIEANVDARRNRPSRTGRWPNSQSPPIDLLRIARTKSVFSQSLPPRHPLAPRSAAASGPGRGGEHTQRQSRPVPGRWPECGQARRIRWSPLEQRVCPDFRGESCRANCTWCRSLNRPELQSRRPWSATAR